ncbi:alpha/beta fold hydrolase [Roseateles sp.]|uniref:alpha/beta fold hydrolase n=1 Tax=Roseateles sp. TaxID=1971397 RepID=UPI00391DF82B
MDGTGDLFQPLLDALGSGIQVQVVRYPEAECWSYERLLAYVLGLLPSGRPFVLLGESFSGPIAIRLAALAPRHLQGLILCCTFARNPRPGLSCLRRLLPWAPLTRMPSVLLSAAILGPWASPELRHLLRQAVARVHPSVMLARARAVLMVDVTNDLASLRLCLQASADRLVPGREAQHIAELLPATKLRVITGPHGLLQAAPVESAKALLAFIRQVATTTPSPDGPACGAQHETVP